MDTTPAPGPPAPAQVRPRQLALLTATAAGVGLITGAGASLFIRVEHEIMHALWHRLPAALGQDEPAWWLVVSILLAGALIVHAATRLPGGGGHHPLAGVGLDIGWRDLPSVLLAALGSLCFGAVLGPEAPLLALGTGLATLAVRRPGSAVQRAMMLVGAMGAVSAIFGNPLITTVLLLELAALAGPAMASTAVLVPSLIGMSASYLLQVGLGDWSGLGEAKLALPGLASYPQVAPVDLAVAIPLAVLVAVLAMAARLAALQVSRIAERRPLATLTVGALVIAAAALAVDGLTGGGIDLVLFSGQAAMTDYLALTSVGTAAVVLAGKWLAYTVSLGSGFRGGAIFPAVALGAVLAAMAALVVDGASIVALAACGIAAATSAVLRMPFTGLLLGAVLTYPAGGGTTVLAAVGTVVGLITRLSADRRLPALARAPGST